MSEPIEIRTPFFLDFKSTGPEAGDWRANPVPAATPTDAPGEVDEEADPKDSSAQVPVSSSDTNQLELDLKAATASVAKDSGQPKVVGPGKLTLPPPPAISIGSDELSARA